MRFLLATQLTLRDWPHIHMSTIPASTVSRSDSSLQITNSELCCMSYSDSTGHRAVSVESRRLSARWWSEMLYMNFHRPITHRSEHRPTHNMTVQHRVCGSLSSSVSFILQGHARCKTVLLSTTNSLSTSHKNCMAFTYIICGLRCRYLRPTNQ